MIVHAIPDWTRTYYGAGDWKAVEAMRLLLADLGTPVRDLLVPGAEPERLLTELNGADRHLLVEYTRWPRMLSRVKARYPHLRIHVRTLNAEAPHYLHQTSRPQGSPAACLRRYYGFFRLLAQDAACRHVADTLLGISAWDDRRYWRKLPGRARILSCPYFSPWPQLRPSVAPLPWADRESKIVCMPGTTGIPIGRAMAENFVQWINAFPDPVCREWDFCQTHHPSAWGPEPHVTSPRLHILRDCHEPWDMLCRIKCVAVLTPLGYGCKTTVTDAVAAGCHVLVHPTLFARLDPCVRDACVLANPRIPPPPALLSRIRNPPPRDGVQAATRRLAHEGLAAAMAAQGQP